MITVALREKMGLPPCFDARVRVSGSAASSNLDKSTLFDQLHAIEPAQRRFVVRFYSKANKVICTWGVYVPRVKRTGARSVSAQEHQDNLKRATYRAAANIRRDLLSIAADRMVTLTYVSNQQNRIVALGHLAQWVRIMRRRFPWWASVTVLEYQERGAVHFHVAVSGFYDIDVLRSEWQAVIGEKSIVNIAFRPDGKGNACSKLASYLSKYLSKEMDSGRKEGEHRYFRTQGIERPREVYHIPLTAPRNEEVFLSLDVIKTLLGSTDQGCPNIFISKQVGHGGGYVTGDLDTKGTVSYGEMDKAARV